MTLKEAFVLVAGQFIVATLLSAYNMQKWGDIANKPKFTKGLMATPAQDSIMVDPTFTMTRDTANAAIAQLQNSIAAKADTGLYVPYSGAHATGTWNINISGNASTVSNGVVTTGSYSNPTWLTGLEWSKITGTPTTVSGYGISDAVTSSGLATALSVYATTSSLTSGLAGKFNTPSGTTAQYLRGDGSLATFPAFGTVTSVGLSSTDFSISGSPVTGSGSITVNLNTSGVSAGSYYGRYTVTNKGIITSAANPLDSVKTRSLNTSYRINLTRDVNVRYSIGTQILSALLGTNTATVYLERSSDNSAWTTIDQGTITSSGVASTIGNSQKLAGLIPTGYYVRIRTAATGVNAGSAVFNYELGLETTN